MRTTFSGIAVALRALQAQQVSLDVTGHNVANANNPNYSRQTAIHSAGKPYPTPMLGYTPSNGQLGTGVQISQINRMRDSFVDLRLRQQLHSSRYWDTLSDGLSQVELFFNEPSENGIHHALDLFWDSLQDLSREPEIAAVREVVVQRANVLVESIKNTRTQLQSLRDNINESIPLKVNEINSLAARLADLNVQIGKISATGSMPNDLLDSRDALLEELSHLVDIEVVQDHSHMVGVTIGGASLVHRGTSYSLMTGYEADVEGNYTKNQILWAATGSKVEIRSGQVGGMLQLRDQEIQKSLNDLDDWTRSFAKVFNAIHNSGFDLYGNVDKDGNPVAELDFFVIPDDDVYPHLTAANIKVNGAIQEDVSLIRASSKPGHDGNGDTALELARLRYERVIDLGDVPSQGVVDSKVTIADYFTSIIASLGVKTQEALKMSENQETLVGHLESLKDSVAGVSLDEEMANMIRYQHAYNAAARMMTTVDEMLDVVINRLGVVGR